MRSDSWSDAAEEARALDHGSVGDEHEVRPLINLLIREHPPNSEWRWGFNWTRDQPRRAVIVAEEGIDLDVALDASRADAD